MSTKRKVPIAKLKHFKVKSKKHNNKYLRINSSLDKIETISLAEFNKDYVMDYPQYLAYISNKFSSKENVQLFLDSAFESTKQDKQQNSEEKKQ